MSYSRALGTVILSMLLRHLANPWQSIEGVFERQPQLNPDRISRVPKRRNRTPNMLRRRLHCQFFSMFAALCDDVTNHTLN